MANSLKLFNNIVIPGRHDNKPITMDVRYIPDEKRKPIVLFVHGFKGFKDWGHFNLLADQMAAQGFVFVKMNLSHNGTTPETLEDFSDLEAFGNNNFGIELDDIGTAIDYIYSNEFMVTDDHIDKDQLYLIGHSRGGGVALIKASEDIRIKKLVAWASVSDFMWAWNDELIRKWRNDGVYYILNGRTKQNMPLNYQIAEDFFSNKERYDLLKASQKLTIPACFIHGDADETVPFQSALILANQNSEAHSHIINGANHVFGGSHPFEGSILPAHSIELINKTLEFIT